MTKNPFKWLYPGIKVKRWFFLSFLGVVIVAVGVLILGKMDQPHPLVSTIGFIWILCGMILTVMGISGMIVSLLTSVLPGGQRELVNILYQKTYLERGPKIVTVGGGTGLSHLIFGLKEYTSNITAVVTVADSGGSSGRLREEFNIVAPGDIRNCLVALADAPELVGKLFQYRFSKESELKGHNFGNLFLTAMYHLTDGDFEKAVNETSKILAIRGKVVPATVSNVHLKAEYMDGSTTDREDKIPNPNVAIKQIALTGEEAHPTKAALVAIEEADVVILGPGSLYTSVIPNLLINGMSDAIVKSHAFKIYICNVMTQHGETDYFTASDHAKAILDHSIPGIIDACLINDAKAPENALERYKEQHAYPVLADIEKIKALGIKVEATDLLGVTDYVRHDSKKLNKALIKLIETHRIIKR
ncbi:MAG: uridine diphosphate-N-acetylglucosamine-binding protein YvcK [Candidatus Omnitrophica bacterium]|nr:uridine diphosphate-N-acetylglucosamine-binding protein YvcK [Candidatus Omnitrophota bacterium]